MGSGKKNARWMGGDGQGLGCVQPYSKGALGIFQGVWKAAERFQAGEYVIRLVLKRSVWSCMESALEGAVFHRRENSAWDQVVERGGRSENIQEGVGSEHAV